MSLVVASILDADWLNLGQEIADADAAGVDAFSLDIMDGHFAPRITFGVHNVAQIRNWTDLPLEVHLMVKQPETLVEKFCDTGADQVVFHLEATDRPMEILETVHARNLLCGIAIQTTTALDELTDELLIGSDVVNVMAVPVGFGGAMPGAETLQRVETLRRRIDGLGTKTAIEVDGGIKPATCGEYASAGADYVVIGTGIYHSNNYGEAVAEAHRNLESTSREGAESCTAPFRARPSRAEIDDAARRGRLDVIREQLNIPRRVWDPITSAR